MPEDLMEMVLQDIVKRGKVAGCRKEGLTRVDGDVQGGPGQQL